MANGQKKFPLVSQEFSFSKFLPIAFAKVNYVTTDGTAHFCTLVYCIVHFVFYRLCLGIAMAQRSAPPSHCKKLLEDGLGTFLDHMSNIVETEAEKRVSYVNSDLLARTFWQPSNLLIVSH